MTKTFKDYSAEITTLGEDLEDDYDTSNCKKCAVKMNLQ